jgi:hypothetical protein
VNVTAIIGIGYALTPDRIQGKSKKAKVGQLFCLFTFVF